jgi:hypothetical protein
LPDFFTFFVPLIFILKTSYPESGNLFSPPKHRRPALTARMPAPLFLVNLSTAPTHLKLSGRRWGR